MELKHHIHVDLSGRTALVTGGASGIGEAISTALSNSGATVIIHYNTSEQRADELVELFRKNGRQAYAINADLNVPEEIGLMFDQIHEKIGGTIDILVNNAGTIISLGDFEKMTLEVWNKTLNLNLTSAMLCSRYAVTGMRKKKWGRIINITSISAHTGGDPLGIAYASSKGGMRAFTMGLAKNLGPDGITVNAIAPGIIYTRIHETFSSKEKLENLRNMTPLKRIGLPEDITGAALFLASDSASYITGETIAVNGGLRMD